MSIHVCHHVGCCVVDECRLPPHCPPSAAAGPQAVCALPPALSPLLTHPLPRLCRRPRHQGAGGGGDGPPGRQGQGETCRDCHTGRLRLSYASNSRSPIPNRTAEITRARDHFRPRLATRGNREIYRIHSSN